MNAKLKINRKMKHLRPVPTVPNLIYPPTCRNMWKARSKFFM